jgi:hypothetical protein
MGHSLSTVVVAVDLHKFASGLEKNSNQAPTPMWTRNVGTHTSAGNGLGTQVHKPSDIKIESGEIEPRDRAVPFACELTFPEVPVMICFCE